MLVFAGHSGMTAGQEFVIAGHDDMTVALQVMTRGLPFE
jgi:hypothetical protein